MFLNSYIPPKIYFILIIVAITLGSGYLFFPVDGTAKLLSSETRVLEAKSEKDDYLKKIFIDKGLQYPPKRLFFRVFKSENVLEVWANNNDGTNYTLIKKYPVCAMSGVLGPKRKQGDYQVPEGFYHISGLNPWSNYYLSLKINYPNKSDRILGRASENLGGDIFIHGQCVSAGCVAITDNYIQEVYWLVNLAQNNGQRRIPVHCFPARLSDLKMNLLQFLYPNEKKMLELWYNLQKGYRYFEENKKPPTVSIQEDGYYNFN